MYWVERIFDDWLIMSKNPKTTMFYHQICQFRLLKSNINRIFNYCHRIMKNQQLLFKKSHGIINYLKVRLYPIIHLLGTSNPWQLEFSADGALWQYFVTKLLWDKKWERGFCNNFSSSLLRHIRHRFAYFHWKSTSKLKRKNIQMWNLWRKA